MIMVELPVCDIVPTTLALAEKSTGTFPLDRRRCNHSLKLDLNLSAA
jgi:hypothetical protein